jgi:hypothetical protein
MTILPDARELTALEKEARYFADKDRGSVFYAPSVTLLDKLANALESLAPLLAPIGDETIRAVEDRHNEMSARSWRGRIVGLYDLEQAVHDRATLLTALRQQQAAMAWRPISSAPKGGTYILAFVPKWGIPWQAIYREEGGRWFMLDDQRDAYGAFEPTHWLPLPNPPEKER